MKFENRIESTSFFLLPCVTILSARRIIPLVESRVDRYREEISDFFLSIKSSKAVIFEEREKKETNKNFDSYFFAYTSNLSGCYETVSSRMINNFLSKVLIIRKARPLKLTSFTCHPRRDRFRKEEKTRVFLLFLSFDYLFHRLKHYLE